MDNRNNFKIIAVRVLKGCSEYIRKVLKENQFYYLCNDYNINEAGNYIYEANSHNDNGFKFQYKNGALENTRPKDETVAEILNCQGIREHVCDILEGGRAAFEKREQKYGFKK